VKPTVLPASAAGGSGGLSTLVQALVEDLVDEEWAGRHGAPVRLGAGPAARKVVSSRPARTLTPPLAAPAPIADTGMTMRMRTAAAVAATCAGAGVAAVVAGRYVSGLALNPRADGPAPPGALTGLDSEPLTVHESTSDTVTLTRCPASSRPGRYALTGLGRHAVIGEVLATHPDRVTRALERVARGTMEPGARVRMSPQLHTGDPESALGLDFDEVAVDGELGDLPAWYVPGDRDTWVITVHGLWTTWAHPLNLVPLLHELRFPVLDVTYRNDPGAPKSPDGIGHLGDTEWRDVDAALRFASRYGAERVVLYGWSIGAAMALRVADHSSFRRRVAGLVLDSPVLEWQTAVRGAAELRGVPNALVPLAVRAAQGRTGLPAERLADSAEPDRLTVPTLVYHGPDDTVAPWRGSRELAARRPELVTLRTVPQAEHQAMWNADPDSYEEALRRFLTPLM
jgi:pimeloyl-ACP methyl ester carboxylesterase